MDKIINLFYKKIEKIIRRVSYATLSLSKISAQDILLQL